MILKVNHEAINDIAEIKKYIRDEYRNPTAANRIADKIVKKYKMLKTSPYIGAPLNAISSIESDYRYLVCGNYIIFYKVLPDFVEVSRIIDGRRDYARVLFYSIDDAEDLSEDADD